MNPETGLPNTPEDTQFWRIRESYGGKYLYLELRQKQAVKLFNWTLWEFSYKVDDEMLFRTTPDYIREEAYTIIRRQELEAQGGNPLVGDYPPKKLG